MGVAPYGRARKGPSGVLCRVFSFPRFAVTPGVGTRVSLGACEVPLHTRLLGSLLDFLFLYPAQGQDNRGSIDRPYQFVGFIHARERLIGIGYQGNEICDRRVC